MLNLNGSEGNRHSLSFMEIRKLDVQAGEIVVSASLRRQERALLGRLRGALGRN